MCHASSLHLECPPEAWLRRATPSTLLPAVALPQPQAALGLPGLFGVIGHLLTFVPKMNATLSSSSFSLVSLAECICAQLWRSCPVLCVTMLFMSLKDAQLSGIAFVFIHESHWQGPLYSGPVWHCCLTKCPSSGMAQAVLVSGRRNCLPSGSPHLSHMWPGPEGDEPPCTPQHLAGKGVSGSVQPLFPFPATPLRSGSLSQVLSQFM